MDKKEIKKNVLDLEYRKYLQVISVPLIFGTIGLIPLIASFIWYPERAIIGLLLTLLIVAIAFVWYKNIRDKINEVLEKIEKL